MTRFCVRFSGVPNIAPSGIILTRQTSLAVRLIHNEETSLWIYTIA